MKYAKIKSKEQFLQVDNKIVDYRNAKTNNSYAKSGTLHEYYSEGIEPESDGFYYMPAPDELINEGIFNEIEIVDHEKINSNTTDSDML